jgi:ABC transporter DrrB family efflux protein
MNRWYPFGQLVLARLREFYREPEVIFWVYGFPLLLAIGLGIAFSRKTVEKLKVDIAENPALSRSVQELLEANDFSVKIKPLEECAKRLETGSTALYLVQTPKGIAYYYDESRPDSVAARYWVETVLLHKKSPESAPPQATAVAGQGYIDFLMPGLMGMNLMGGGLWGVGFVLVDFRVRKLLKRLLATPMRRADFLLSILAARLVFMVPDMLILLLVGHLGFGVPIYGSLATLLLVIVVGGAAFSGLGLLIACRAQKSETVSGLMNLVMLPMWLLSGIFFSSKRFPEAAQPFIQALPLTQLNDALRGVMLEGEGLTDIGWRLGILAAWAVACFFLALRWFRWQ